MVPDRTSGAKPTTVERVLTKVKRVGDVCWLEVALARLQEDAKVAGQYTEGRFALDSQREGFRVAGKSRGDVAREFMIRLASKIDAL